MTASVNRHVALDVHYTGECAVAAAVVFHEWEDPAEYECHVISVDEVAEYQSGSFYLRELLCLEKVLDKVGDPITTIVIDGYVALGEDQRPGLGMRLWESLGRKVPVIGVAKSPFRGAPDEARLLRGNSSRPLFISSVGIPLNEAKRRIASMHGAHRIPTLLKNVDRLSRVDVPHAPIALANSRKT